MFSPLATALIATSLLGALPGCEGEESPSIEGASRSEATEITAAVSCDYFARCGVARTSCSATSGDGSDPDCETTVHPLEVDECLDEAEDLLGPGFECAELDASLRSLVDSCLEAFEVSTCPDPEAVAQTLGMPEVCADAFEQLLECTADQDAPPPAVPVPTE